MSSLKFGTSGLRGLVTDLTPDACRSYTAAFVHHLRAAKALQPGQAILVGRDLRSSSGRIAQDVLGAIRGQGFSAVDCGELPTPALALHAMRVGSPAVMVTGSHIPDDRNGLKFYRADGEIDKADEQGILAALATAMEAPAAASTARTTDEALGAYTRRYLALGSDLLSGLTIGVYQHSSIARDLLVSLLQGLGASVLAYGRSDTFVPVDTEALRPEDVSLARDWAAAHDVDAIVSTDGDADRPLIADAAGRFIRGDLVGTLTAQWLEADQVVTPVTSTSSIERSGLFCKVIRTRVGSPYVIAGMAEADGHVVVGFEANGGVLMGGASPRRQLEALPTRDAALPIIAVLALAKEKGLPLSELVATLPARFTASDRLTETPASATTPFLERLTQPQAAGEFLQDIGPLQAVDVRDGVRLTLTSGETIHFRASGNAPELRCYTEADTDRRADQLLRWGLEKAKALLV